MTAANKTLAAEEYLVVFNLPSLSILTALRAAQSGVPAERGCCFVALLPEVPPSLRA